MASTNDVLVSFQGKDDGLGKESKTQKENIKGVGDESKKTDEQIQKTGDSGTTAGDKIGKGFKVGAAAVAAAGVAAAAVVGKLATDAIKAYADFEQLSGGVDKLFGTASDAVMANAKDAYKTAGLSANAYMESVTGFSASLIGGLKGDTTKAADLANVAISDMSDNANTYGTDMESIQKSYQGFAKGQFGMLDNLKLGYGGSQAEMARLINDSGVLGSTMVDAASVSEVSMDKIIEAIHKTQENMGIAGTTAKEAASTISGSFASTQAAWTNVLASFGSGSDMAIEEAVNGLIESAGNFATNISKILPDVLGGVTGLIQVLITEIPPLLATLLPALIDGVVRVIEGLVDAIPGLIDTLTKVAPDLVAGIVKIFLSILDALPEIIDGFLELFSALAEALLDPKVLTKLIKSLAKAIIGLVDSIVKFIKDPKALETILQGAITLFLEIVKALPEIIIALVKAIPEIIKSLVKFLTDPKNLEMILQAMVTLGLELVKAIPLIIVEIVKAIGELIPGLKGVFEKIPEVVKKVWNGIVDWVKGLPEKIVSAFGAIKEGIKGAFTSAIDSAKGVMKKGINWIIEKINKVIKGFNKLSGKIPGVGDKLQIPEIPELANGGYVGLAGGGRVSGPGSGTSDSIPAMLSNGEFVLKAQAVRNLGLDNVAAINEGQTPQASGPIVGVMNVREEADALALAQTIGALVRFA
jgi:hypothetical protein